MVSVYDGDTITVLHGKEQVRLRISALSPPPHQTLSRRGGRRRVADVKPALIALLALELGVAK